MSGSAPRHALSAPLLAGAAAALLYLLTAQVRIFGDGIFFGEKLERGALLYFHLLYLPAATAVHRLLEPLFGVEPEASLRVLSALAGGTAVTGTWLAGRAVLGDERRAGAAAALLAVTPGHWFHATATEVHAFHAAFTTLLWAGLAAALARGRVRGGMLGVATAGTLASHLSGVAAGLPVAVALGVAPRAVRGRLLRATAIGVALFGAVALVVAATTETFASARTVSNEAAGSVLGKGVVHLVGVLGQELLLLSVPASVLAVAGLCAAWRSQRRVALLALAWLAAWPVLAAPIGDQGFGSYYTPLFPVVATLAVFGFGAVREGRRGLALAVALAPAVPFLLGDRGLALAVYGASAVGATLLTDPPATAGQRERPWRPALAAVLVSVPLLAPHVRSDPLRARIASVAEVVGDDFVVLVSRDSSTNHHFRRFLPGEVAGRLRMLDLGELHYMEPAPAAARAADTKRLLDALLHSGARVWLIGDPHTADMAPAVTEVLAHLRAHYRLEHPDGAPAGVLRIAQP